MTAVDLGEQITLLKRAIGESLLPVVAAIGMDLVNLSRSLRVRSRRSRQDGPRRRNGIRLRVRRGESTSSYARNTHGHASSRPDPVVLVEHRKDTP